MGDVATAPDARPGQLLMKVTVVTAAVLLLGTLLYIACVPIIPCELCMSGYSIYFGAVIPGPTGFERIDRFLTYYRWARYLRGSQSCADCPGRSGVAPARYFMSRASDKSNDADESHSRKR